MFLGFDTSNYTTSAATFDGTELVQQKQLLAVKKGGRGLRQSEAVFQHTVNLPKLMDGLAIDHLQAVGVSTRPRNAEGSYMPCFLVGEGTASAVAKACGVPLYRTSHQVGHLLAALYSAGRLDLTHQRFLAFHLSGGTTEVLLVTPDREELLRAEIVAQSLDLKAGQAIDRTGVRLGLSFPCGRELDALAQKSDRSFRIKPSMKGLDCSLSGVENKAEKMVTNGESREDVACFVLSYIAETVLAMTDGLVREYGEMPIVFSGGVSSNTLLRKTISKHYGAYFAAPAFSLDNAAGTALYAYLKENKL